MKRTRVFEIKSLPVQPTGKYRFRSLVLILSTKTNSWLEINPL